MQVLAEQLQLLAKSCLEYDIFSPLHGLDIAHRLRVLAHQTGASHSIIHQLNIEQNAFVSTKDAKQPMMYDANGTAAMPVFSLLKPVWGFQDKTITLFPILDDHNMDSWLPFETWWASEIIASAADPSILVNIVSTNPSIRDVGYSFTRKDLVLKYANKLGGSHLDPNPGTLLERIYKNERGIDGWLDYRTNEVTGESEILQSSESPFLGEVRQIAHELLLSLEKIFPSQLNIQEHYSEKVLTYRLIGHNKDEWKSGASAQPRLESIGNAMTAVISFNNKASALGLAHIEPDFVFEHSQYEFCILAESDGRYCAMEKGRLVSDWASYTSGDVFGFIMAEINSQVKIFYIHNDKVIYQSKRSPVLPLTFYAAMKHLGAQISDAKFYSYKSLPVS